MNLKTKKIIAREGLIIVILLFIGAILIFPVLFFEDTIKEKIKNTNSKKSEAIWDAVAEETFPSKQEEKLQEHENRIKELTIIEKKLKLQKSIIYICAILGLFLIIPAYPLYWLARFIIWSIRTLRQKET